MIQFNLWSRRIPVGGENADGWGKADNELSTAYGHWAKHVGGAIDITFRVPRTDRSGLSLEGYQRDVKKFFPRLTENAPVTIVCN